PRLIVLRYDPPNARGDVTLGLVGKAITFDTGGISLKPSLHMENMKGDMSGGAAVIAATCAIADLQLPVRVLAVVAATENMPGGHAYRPGDIVKAMNGKTIEVVNTDAEGRLVLADMKNASDLREGSPVLAAEFLREFAGEGPWAHLDIAGPAFLDRPRGDYLWQPGGTGYGVRLIAELASRLNG